MIDGQKRSLGIGVAVAFVLLAGCCFLGIGSTALMWFFTEDDDEGIDNEDEPIAVANSEEATDHAEAQGELRFESMGLGVHQGCAIDTEQQLHCWGHDRLRLREDEPQGEFIDVAAGQQHRCAIDTDHRLHCWGYDMYGNLEDVPSGEFQKVVTKANVTCAMTLEGELQCWGAQDIRRDILEVPDGQFETFDIGDPYAGCAIDDRNRIQCWGDDSRGVLSEAPSGKFHDIAVGGGHACALDDDGEMVCWGTDETPTQKGRRIEDAPSGQFAQVEAYSLSSCVRHKDGPIECWGYREKFDFDDIPKTEFETMEMGPGYVCGLDASQAITCWGKDDHKQMMDPP